MRKRNWPNRKNRPCPDCGKMLTYTRKDTFDRAVGNNSVCKSCAQMDRKLTLETIEKMRKPKTVEHKRKISIGQYKRSYSKYLLEVEVPNLSFTEFVEVRKEGY